MIFDMNDITDFPFPNEKTEPESNYLLRLINKTSGCVKFGVMEFYNNYGTIDGKFAFDMLEVYDVTHWIKIDNQ